MRAIIIDLDGVAAQTPLAERIADGRARRVEARDLEVGLRLVATNAARRELMRRVDDVAAGDGPPVYFYGSGDFHHLCATFLEVEREPLTVIHFDHRADWRRWPRTHNCGSWVCRALETPCVDKVISLGPDSDDLEKPQLALADLPALRAGRIELYPWSRGPSRVWGDVGEGPSFSSARGELHWRTLARQDWSAFLASLCDRIATRRVWITLDKCCLSRHEAVANWDQGKVPLNHALEAIALFARRFEIAGIDVCGDYSPPRFRDPLRAVLAHFDHPEQPDAATAARADAVNAAANARLLDCFEACLA